MPWTRKFIDHVSTGPGSCPQGLQASQTCCYKAQLRYMVAPGSLLCVSITHFCFSSYITVAFIKKSQETTRSLITMQWTTLLVAAAFTQSAVAQNMLRFACSQLVVERTDPLVNPGMKYTPHLHQIVGGNAFNVTMDPSQDPAALSTCTSCNFVQDKSNYWTAVMFFKAKNGTYM
jgi:hypothetical protein